MITTPHLYDIYIVHLNLTPVCKDYHKPIFFQIKLGFSHAYHFKIFNIKFLSSFYFQLLSDIKSTYNPPHFAFVLWCSGYLSVISKLDLSLFQDILTVLEILNSLCWFPYNVKLNIYSYPLFSVFHSDIHLNKNSPSGHRCLGFLKSLLRDFVKSLLEIQVDGT